MDNSNLLPSMRFALAAMIQPDSLAPSTVSTTWVSMVDYENIVGLMAVNDIAATATVDMKIEQAKDDAGTDAKDVDGKVIVQLDDTKDQTQKMINCRADELDVNNDFTHVRLSVTVATAACDVVGMILGFDPRSYPAEQPATVDQVIGNSPIV